MEKILKIAEMYNRKLLKLAAYPTVESCKIIIEDVIEELVDKNEDLMEGVLYVSNVQLQKHQMENEFLVNFILNVDIKKEEILNRNQAARQGAVQSAVLSVLQKTHPEFGWKLKFNEMFTKDPGWFGDKYK